MTPTSFDEVNHTIQEVAGFLKVTATKAAEIFANEPGVIDLSLATKKFSRKRRYRVLRIPHSVFVRVRDRCQVQAGGQRKTAAPVTHIEERIATTG